ncbi:glutamine amidotransferase [Venturia nashicola]|uniref:glutaminase n=1 Tax=Venturia nashicola TaxID=86259 RepID=A0A4Z1NF88_9PEZI|nr:glutamine amidotransferase [Venturia nashicola]TLD15311.1 glutamine amidotransferase [Venturia nashicola]
MAQTTPSSPIETLSALGITVGVLALQGAFSEHIQLLRESTTKREGNVDWTFIEVRTPEELERCDGLIIPGGESTTISLVAARSGILDPLREFVKVKRLPAWGTCAGLILLSESANTTSTKAGGQELIGGLDVLINRNHFGRQVESFSAELDLPFLSSSNAGVEGTERKKFQSVFIRAPVVEKLLPHKAGAQEEGEGRVVAPSKSPADAKAEELISAEVEIMARLPGRAKAFAARKSEIGGLESDVTAEDVGEEGDIIAVRQGNVFGTSFHPELTGDGRIHVWWLGEVEKATRRRRGAE